MWDLTGGSLEIPEQRVWRLCLYQVFCLSLKIFKGCRIIQGKEWEYVLLTNVGVCRGIESHHAIGGFTQGF